MLGYKISNVPLTYTLKLKLGLPQEMRMKLDLQLR